MPAAGKLAMSEEIADDEEAYSTCCLLILAVQMEYLAPSVGCFFARLKKSLKRVIVAEPGYRQR